MSRIMVDFFLSFKEYKRIYYANTMVVGERKKLRKKGGRG